MSSKIKSFKRIIKLTNLWIRLYYLIGRTLTELINLYKNSKSSGFSKRLGRVSIKLLANADRAIEILLEINLLNLEYYSEHSVKGKTKRLKRK